MRRNLLFQGLLLLVLSSLLGCSSDPRKASNDNFAKAIGDSWDTDPVCLGDGEPFPREVKLFNMDPGVRDMGRIGLLENSRNVTGGSHPNQMAVEYSLSELGRRTINSDNRFCFGRFELQEVVRFTEPAEKDGKVVSVATIVKSAVDVPGTINELSLGANPPQGYELASPTNRLKLALWQLKAGINEIPVPMVLNSDGWAVDQDPTK